MIVNQGQNEYHHLKVLEIKDYSRGEHPCVIIKGQGKTFYRNTRTNSGYSIEPYRITVIVKGQLMDYVLYEIDEEDLIFVIGHTEMCKPSEYQYVRALKAAYIYKEDWVKYYNNYGNINPKDTEDMI